MTRELYNMVERLEKELAEAKLEAARYKAQLITLQAMANVADGGYNSEINSKAVVRECLRIKL